jgi:hypothetical protein
MTEELGFMPRRSRISFKALFSLVLMGLAAMAVFRRGGDDWEYEQAEAEVSTTEHTPAVETTRSRRRPARFALAAGFTTLFFAGAAFTAGAGDQAVRLMQDDAAALEEFNATAADPAVEDAAAAEAPAVAEQPAAEPAAAPATGADPAAAPAPEAPAEPAAEPVAEAAAEPASEPAPFEVASEVAPAAKPSPSNVVAPTPVEPEPADEQPAAPARAAAPAPVKAKPAPTKQWVVKRAAAKPARAPEIEHDHGSGYGQPTVWLNRALPDPTPASARLTRPFARQLAASSIRHDADWAAVLGVLRAQGERGSVPAGPGELDTLADRLAGRDAWKGALAVSGRTAFADRAAALADLYRSVGIEALVTGFEAAKDRLAEKLLDREGVLIYGGGRDDIAAGRIDVRVIVLIGYLAERHGSVTVSSLFSGHRMFARPGVVSAHIYGHAVDVAAVGGTPIAGHQEPGGLTETAVRSVLLLPAELQPQQVISLLGLGGPSFPLRDHGDHIHVGF